MEIKTKSSIWPARVKHFKLSVSVDHQIEINWAYSSRIESNKLKNVKERRNLSLTSDYCDYLTSSHHRPLPYYKPDQYGPLSYSSFSRAKKKQSLFFMSLSSSGTPILIALFICTRIQTRTHLHIQTLTHTNTHIHTYINVLYI